MPEPLRLIAGSIGQIAARALQANLDGEVVAVFERSFYARFGEQLVCVGFDLPDGPLNAPSVPARWSDTFAPLIADGDRVGVERTDGLEPRIALDLTDALTWRPERPPPLDVALLRSGLRNFAAALPPSPIEGLGGLLHGRDTPLIRRACTAVNHLAEVVRTRMPPHSDTLAQLVGLGPGLTPSGDDYLGGVLIALASAARDQTAQAIWGAIAPMLPSATNAISAAHLAAAAEGLGSAPLHAIIAATLAGGDERLAASISDLTRIGHTSGWDALAGAGAALTAAAYSAASTCPR